MQVKMKDLKLADVVILSPATPYRTATVKKVTAETVTFFRPYVHTADFAYTGGVICYIGLEEFVADIRDETYDVIARVELK